MNYELKYLKYKNKYFVLKQNIYGYSQIHKNMVGYGKKPPTPEEKKKLEEEAAELKSLFYEQKSNEKLLLEKKIAELISNGIDEEFARKILTETREDVYDIIEMFKDYSDMHDEYKKYNKKEYSEIIYYLITGARKYSFYKLKPSERQKKTDEWEKVLIEKTGIDKDIAHMIVTDNLDNDVDEFDINKVIELFDLFKDMLVKYNNKQYSTIIYNMISAGRIGYMDPDFLEILKLIFSKINLNDKIFTKSNLYDIMSLPYGGSTKEHVPLLKEFLLFFLNEKYKYKIYENPKHIFKLVDAVLTVARNKRKSKLHSYIEENLPKYVKELKA